MLLPDQDRQSEGEFFVLELEISQDCALPISAMSLDKVSSFLREHEFIFSKLYVRHV